MAQHINIKSFGPNQFIDGTYAIQNCQLGQTRTGKPFLKCLLQDSTGRAPGRMWNATEELFSQLPTNGFVWIEGQTQPYQGEMQVIIQKIAAIDPTPEDLATLLPSTQRDVEEMFSQLYMLIMSLENPAIKALADTYIADTDLMDKLRVAPAAMTLHHAYLGGLLEHTLSLMQLAEGMLEHYPQLNRDIVLMGLFLHDLGKTSELTWQTGFGYTDEGQLIGHIGRGLTMLHDHVRACESEGTDVPTPIVMVLEHIILSHHGKFEFGALKIPATPEAIFISHLDDLDAKMQMAISSSRSDDEKTDGDQNETSGGNFTEKIWALETRLYRPDPTKVAK